MITYKPLRHLLIERDLAKTEFAKMVGLAPGTASKLWKDDYVALEVIDRICEVLDCEISDVVQRVK
ncbi:hypothetical protein J40TS1_33870 [Paenibacillus montaniterrae]|uniref:HTH cro/C1-type domain-containing protein n=1 Tax=Paenibacillus montaniterrae TaxID=429341 RepID=A0A919YQD6_9BACL|nr:helix-turn-helix transcriptional regulator [Paenibacillus montaniterrae]GIP17745.1 hypothetical protein J40TS1_33870 [Paenibacillus montaniterrae]